MEALGEYPLLRSQVLRLDRSGAATIRELVRPDVAVNDGRDPSRVQRLFFGWPGQPWRTIADAATPESTDHGQSRTNDSPSSRSDAHVARDLADDRARRRLVLDTASIPPFDDLGDDDRRGDVAHDAQAAEEIAA